MQVDFYMNTSDTNTIRNTREYKFTKECTIKGEFSLENPAFIIAFSELENRNFNYIYVPEVSRFYFVKNTVRMTGNLFAVECEVDVLESFQNEILSLVCIVDKQEYLNKANKYYDDNSYVNLPKETVNTINFTNGFNENGSYVLICAGGEGGLNG